MLKPMSPTACFGCPVKSPKALAAVTRGDDPQAVVAQLARSITNKLIHAPTAGLKKASAEGRHDVLGHAVRLLDLPRDALEATAALDESAESSAMARGGNGVTAERGLEGPSRAAEQPAPTDGAVDALVEDTTDEVRPHPTLQ